MIDPALTSWLLVLNVMQFIAFCVFCRFDRGIFLTLAVPCALAALRASASVLIPGFDRIEADNLAILFIPYCAVYFTCAWPLSRDVPGRKLFLMFVYAVYEIPYAVFAWAFYHDYAAVLGPWLVAAINMALVIFIHAIWIFVILPQTRALPSNVRWRGPILIVLALTLVEHAAGVWPQSLMDCTLPTLVSFVVLTAVITATFPIVMRYFRANIQTAQLRDLEASMQLLAAEAKGRREILEEARRIRHDRRHHTLVLQELVEKGDLAALRDYVRKMSDSISEPHTGPLPVNDRWCPNELVNAILAGFARQALARGIDFRTDLKLAADLPLPEIDFAPLLANLLENALHAAGRVEHPYVALRLVDDAGVLRIHVANPVPDGFALVRGLPTDEPGIGIASVQLIVRRYAGFMDYQLRDRELVCRVSLSKGN